MAYSQRSNTRSDTPARSNTSSPFEFEAPPQNFEFVNFDTSTPAVKDPNQRKVIRAHVVRDWSRRKKLQRLQSDKLKGRKIQPSILPAETSNSTTSVDEPAQEYFNIRQSTQRAVEVLHPPTHDAENGFQHREKADPADSLGDGSPILESEAGFDEDESSFSRIHNWLVQQPDPEADAHLVPIVRRVRDIANAMFPLSSVFKFNPVCPEGCVGWHIRDKAAYHGILYATSTYANLVSGKRESKDATLNMGKVVAIVNARLNEMTETGSIDGVGEGLIGAVGSLALAESLKGNYDGWRIHMAGVKHLTSLKGGLSGLSTNLRHKLFRSDLHGARGSLTSPFFIGADRPSSPFNSSPPMVSSSLMGSSLSSIRTSLDALLMTLPVTHGLRTTLMSMRRLSDVISQEIATTAKCSQEQQAMLLEHTYSLNYSLLRPWSAGEWNDDLHPMDECLRVAGLLYLHATWQDFPFALDGTKKLLDRLKELVIQVEVSGEEEEGLMVWLLFVGAICTNKNDSRIWFIANIQRLVENLHLDSWETVRARLSQLWWIERIHGKLCKAAWDEVVVLNSVFVGG